MAIPTSTFDWGTVTKGLIKESTFKIEDLWSAREKLNGIWKNEDDKMSLEKIKRGFDKRDAAKVIADDHARRKVFVDAMELPRHLIDTVSFSDPKFDHLRVQFPKPKPSLQERYKDNPKFGEFE